MQPPQAELPILQSCFILGFSEYCYNSIYLKHILFYLVDKSSEFKLGCSGEI